MEGIASLFADPKVSHPRIAIFDAATGAHRIVKLPNQDGWEFYPTDELEWR